MFHYLTMDLTSVATAPKVGYMKVERRALSAYKNANSKDLITDAINLRHNEANATYSDAEQLNF
jgi:hypothetical protein